MKKFIEKLENYTCTTYGFESKKTINTFKFTAMMRKAFSIR